jgi:hypothetical protein
MLKERFISGGGTYPVIGSYDEVAATFLRLSEAGLDGMALASVNYAREMPVIRDEVLPRQQWLLTYGFVTSDPGDLGRLHLRISNLAAEEQGLGYLRDYWRARAALARAAGDWQGLAVWPAKLDSSHQNSAN